jgi:hypothetical protein
LGGSCMCYLPGNNFFGPFYHTKKSLTIKFYRYTVVVYLPKKTCQRTPGRSRGPQRGPKGSCCSAWSSSGWRIAITALERAQSQIHEESMIQQTRCWKGHNQRVSNRAMSYLELEIHGLVAWQGNPLNSPDVFFQKKWTSWYWGVSFAYLYIFLHTHVHVYNILQYYIYIDTYMHINI